MAEHPEEPAVTPPAAENLTPPQLPEVEVASTEEVLDGVPSVEEILEDVPSVEEVVERRR